MSTKALALSVVVGATLGKNYFNTFDTAKQKAVKLGQAYKETDNKLKAANGVVKYRELLKTLKAKQDAAGGSSKQLARGIKDVEKKYKEAKQAAKGYQLSIGSITREQRKLSRETHNVEMRIGRVNKMMEAQNKLSALRGKALGGLGLAYAGGNMIGKAFEVEDKQLQLGDVINGVDREKRLQASMANAKAFAKNSLASETDVLEIDYSLRSSGLGDEAARFGSQIVSKVATVTKGSASDVGFIIGDTFMNVRDSLEGSVEQKITRIGDVLTKTKNLFSIKDFNQLGEGLKESLSGALANNLSLEQTAALIGQINNGMLKGSQAGTGLSAILRQLPKASDDLGFDIVRDGADNLDMIATLEALKESLDSYEDIDERAQAIQKAFGDEGKKGLVPLLDGLDDLKKNYQEVNEQADGTLDENYQRRLASASGQWKMFTQNVVMVGAAFGGTLLPAVNMVLQPVGKLMGFIADGIGQFPIIGQIIGGIAAGVAVYGVGLGVATAAQWAFNAAILANPIGAAIAGLIGGVIVVATLVHKYWDPIKTFFTGIWDSIKIGASGALDVFKTVFSYSPIGLMIKAWGAAFDWINSKFSGIGELVGKVREWFGVGDAAKSSNVVSLAKHRQRRGRDLRVGSAVGVAANDASFAQSAPVMTQGNLALKPQSSSQAVEHTNYQVTIHQQPGEDAVALTDRVVKEMSRRRSTRRRGALHDG